MIAEQLQSLAVPVDNLVHDPDNARRGDMAAVRRSLNVFGQRKPVVAKRTGTDSDGRPTGIVEAGNTTFAAACDLGWTHIAAVFVDDDATTARAFALADNRTGELATWDENQLAESLAGLEAEDFDLATLGWSGAELADLLKRPADLAAFKEVDEGAATGGTLLTCPECGHEFES
jgi:ParB-like chromosome segregation protein Spo0J